MHTTAVLTITAMPTRLRMAVEDALVTCVPSESQLYVPGADPLTAAWCTQWRPEARGLAGCRQVITGTEAELADLAVRLGELAWIGGFEASVRVVD